MTGYTSNKHKRGDTFDLSGSVEVTSNGVSVSDFTGWSGRCQVRAGDGSLIEELIFEWLNISTGLLRIRSAAPTEGWPLGPARTDIQLTSPSGDVVSTETAVIEIVEDITR